MVIKKTQLANLWRTIRRASTNLPVNHRKQTEPTEEPAGEPSGEASTEPAGEPSGEASTEPAGEPSEQYRTCWRTIRRQTQSLPVTTGEPSNPSYNAGDIVILNNEELSKIEDPNDSK